MARVQRTEALLLVIDVQEKLLPVISGGDAVARNLELLIRGCHRLDMPIVVTEQHVEGLGTTVAALRAVLLATVGYTPIQKMSFSAYGSGELQSALRLARRKEIIVAGIEAHVCVYQTVSDLLAADFNVTVVADAVASRAVENRDVALRRMTVDGARISSTEMVLFELLGVAGTDEFRALLKLIK